MQNLQFSSGCGGKLYPIKCELWGEVTPRVRNSHQHLSGVGSSGPPPPMEWASGVTDGGATSDWWGRSGNNLRASVFAC